MSQAPHEPAPEARVDIPRVRPKGVLSSRITMAAMTDTPRQKSPTLGNPPSASISPPMAGPPNAPIWLLTANNPVAVVREFPASSSNNVGVTADEILARPAVPQASATVAHGDTRAVKTTAARSPLPQHAMANQAKCSVSELMSRLGCLF